MSKTPKSTPRERETQEVAAAALRFVRALGRRVADGDPDELLHFKALKAEIKQAEAAAVAGLRAQGHSDAFIAEALGVSQPAVTMRWRRTRKEVA